MPGVVGDEKADREVDMIGHTAGAVTFAIAVTGDGGEIGVEVGTDVRGEEGSAVLGAEDEMDQGQVEGLRHGGEGG